MLTRRSVIWLILFVIHCCFSVKKEDFKTCSQSSFCKRQRAVKPNDSLFAVKSNSLKLQDDGHVQATLVNKVDNRLFQLDVYALADHTFRIRMDEHEGLRARYSPTEALDGQPKLGNFKAGKMTSTTRSFLNEDGDKVIVYYDPFRLDAYYSDSLVMSLNSQQLMKMEHFRTTGPPPVAKSWSERLFRAGEWVKRKLTFDSDSGNSAEQEAADGDEEQKETEKETEEEPPKAQPKPADEKVEEGMGEETWKTHKDSKPFGTSSVGFDVSFIGFEDLFGLPEHADTHSLKTTTGTGQEPYRLYNLDVFEYELNSPMALYGSIPYIIAQSVESTVGLFWLNAAEMWVDIKSSTADKSMFRSLVDKLKTTNEVPKMDTHWMAETGLLDIFMFMGPRPKDVFRQYAKLTGVTPLPPLFSIGYHQCRWNYNDQEDVRGVHQGFEEHDIPVDVIWLDIEYTDGKRYFTWDKNKFPDPAQMTNELAAKGRKLVTIIDPHIKKDNNYPVYKLAKDNNYFVKDRDGNDFDGWCWPGSSAYLDFFNPVVQDYWSNHYKLDQYQGSTLDTHIWNDMNEPSVFNGPEITMHKDCKHHGGWEHRDVHNMYGFLNHRSTFKGLVARSEGKFRPFLLTRAFFAGSQRYGAVWTGDNIAGWDHLAASVPMLLSMSVAGLPFVGADVGGFFKNPDEELLVRWYQLGSWYPFFRAHAHQETKRREPWLWSESGKQTIRDAIRRRYKFLPYWYTQFYDHSVTGMPVMRPLWAEFPDDIHSINEESQFMIGSDILIRPVTEAGKTTVSVYLPGKESAWYDLDTLRQHRGPGAVLPDTPLSKTPVYLRGGSIIPVRERVRRSASLMNHDPITLYIAINYQADWANGTLYLDDAQTYRYQEGDYIHRLFEYTGSFSHGQLVSKNLHPEQSSTACGDAFIERIMVLGMRFYPDRVQMEYGGGSKALSYKLKQDSMSLTIRKPGVKIGTDFKITIS